MRFTIRFFYAFIGVCRYAKKETTISTTSSRISCETLSENEAFRATMSRAFTCSHMITPLVLVRLSRVTCKGKPLSVLVIGHTKASRVNLLNVLLLTTSAGRLPFCSCPACGSKSRYTMSPCSKTRSTTAPLCPLAHRSPIRGAHTLPGTLQYVPPTPCVALQA